eukprot:1160200-Pelagomonas_calceolata.AAC.4
MDNTDQFLPCTQAHACTRVSTRGTHTHTHTHTVAFAAAQGAMSAQISSAIGVAALAGLLRLQTLDVAYTAIQDAGLASLEVREDTHPLGSDLPGLVATMWQASPLLSLPYNAAAQSTFALQATRIPYPFIHNLSSMLSLMSGRSRGNYPEAEPLKGLVHLNLDSCRFSSEGCKCSVHGSDKSVVRQGKERLHRYICLQGQQSRTTEACKQTWPKYAHLTSVAKPGGPWSLMKEGNMEDMEGHKQTSCIS